MFDQSNEPASLLYVDHGGFHTWPLMKVKFLPLPRSIVMVQQQNLFLKSTENARHFYKSY